MRYLISLLIVLLLFGCGGDSSNTNAQVTPTTKSLVGSYTLSDISGTAWVNGSLTDLAGANVSVSGTLNFDDTNFHYELIVTVSGTPDEITTFTEEGIYTISYTTAPTDGSITVLTSSKTQTSDFAALDKELFIDVTGILGGGTYNAQETWLKESDTPVFP